MMGWQWQQLDHVQIICTSLQIDNHQRLITQTFYRHFTGQMLFLTPNQQRESTEGKDC